MIKKLLVSALFVVTMHSFVWANPAYTEYYTTSDRPTEVLLFEVTDTAMLQMDIVQGNVTLRRHSNNNEVKVEVFVRRGVRILSRERADDFRQVSQQRGNTISLRSHPQRSGASSDVSLSYVVFVPETINAQISLTNGNIETLNVGGNHRYSVTSGNITVENMNGQAQVMVTAGSLQVTQLNGVLMAQLNGGNVTVSGIRGESRILLNGGFITLHDVRGAAVAEVKGGGIAASITEITEAIVFNVTAGSIDLTIPSTLKADLTAKGRRIEIGRGNDWITGVDEKSETALYNLRDIVRGQIGSEEMVLKLNGGGKPLQAQATMGMVKVRFD